MKNLHKSGLTPLLGAIMAVSGSSVASAATYEVSLSGFALNQSTTIQNVPGVPTAASPPLYQLPRLGAFGPPGWPGLLEISIDATTGEVVNFRSENNSGGLFGSGGPQNNARGKRLTYTAGTAYLSQFTGGPAVCSVVNGGNDADGVLEYECPDVTNSSNFANVDVNGVLCATDKPSTLAPGANGCGARWGGFPNGFANPQVSTRAGLYVPANHSVGGVSVSLTGVNPAWYISLDHVQNTNSYGVQEFQGVRSGGNFTINHTGTLAGGDFVVTDVDYTHRSDIAFVIATNPPGVLGAAQSFTSWDFDTVISQEFVLDNGEAKAVPAMGTFGLAALFGGLVALAARLRRRVS